MNNTVLANNGIVLDIYQSDNLQEWIELFIHSCRSRNLSSGTVKFYIMKLNVFLAFCTDMAVSKVSEITPNIIRQFLIFLEERHHKPAGVHCFYRSVKTFLKWYEVEVEPADWQNPIEKVRAPVIPLEPLDPVSVDTIRSMIEAGGSVVRCEHTDLINARDKAILLFLLDTGVRLSELLGLNRNDVNPITGLVQIRQGKGRKPRNVYLGETARLTLKRYLKKRQDIHPALWIGNGGERLTGAGLRMMLRRRANRAHVPVPSPHDFRRAFAIERWRAGTDIITLSKLMGHSGLQILDRYLKQVGEDLEQAARETSPVDRNF